jgi:hypothetical protein
VKPNRTENRAIRFLFVLSGDGREKVADTPEAELKQTHLICLKFKFGVIILSTSPFEWRLLCDKVEVIPSIYASVEGDKVVKFYRPHEKKFNASLSPHIFLNGDIAAITQY